MKNKPITTTLKRENVDWIEISLVASTFQHSVNVVHNLRSKISNQNAISCMENGNLFYCFDWTIPISILKLFAVNLWANHFNHSEMNEQLFKHWILNLEMKLIFQVCLASSYRQFLRCKCFLWDSHLICSSFPLLNVNGTRNFNAIKFPNEFII